MTSFVDSVTTSAMCERLNVLEASRPDIDVMLKMLGPNRRAEWLHALGPVFDADLRQMLPPVAPLNLRNITAQSSEEAFRWRGAVDINTVFALYEHIAGRSENVINVLDFGCGCGRLCRYVGMSDKHKAFASEANPNHVAWCSANLPTVTTRQNLRTPPLPFADESMDLIYAWSVFTHLPESEARAWFADLARMLRSGGMVIATIHSYTALKTLMRSDAHQKMLKMDSRKAIAVSDELAKAGYVFLPYGETSIALANVGPDYGNTFIDATRCLWNELKLVAHLEGRAVPQWQDALVLAKA